MQKTLEGTPQRETYISGNGNKRQQRGTAYISVTSQDQVERQAIRYRRERRHLGLSLLHATIHLSPFLYRIARRRLTAVAGLARSEGPMN